MNLHLIGNVLLGLLLIGVLAYRQTTWRPVVIAQMWRMPLIVGIVGVVMLVQSSTVVTGLDAAVLVIELVVSLGVGAWTGAIAHFRPLDRPTEPDRRGHVAHYASRTGWLGLALWMLVIAVRVGIDAIAVHLGAHAATATGVILIMLAANRAARVAVFGARLDRHRKALPTAPSSPHTPV